MKHQSKFSLTYANASRQGARSSEKKERNIKEDCTMNWKNLSFIHSKSVQYYDFIHYYLNVMILYGIRRKLLKWHFHVKLCKPPPTLSIYSRRSSNWILRRQASWSSSEWSLLALISPKTLSIHLIRISIFSAATAVLGIYETPLSGTSRMLKFRIFAHLDRSWEWAFW